MNNKTTFQAEFLRNLKDKRLLIVEEALKNHTGHWYEYNKAVIEYNKEYRVNTCLLANTAVDKEIQQELAAVPFFNRTNWDGIYDHRLPWRRYWGIISHNWYVFKTMNKFFKKNKAFDCVFVPTVVIHHWVAWLFIAWKFKNKKIKRLVLFIRNSAGSYPNGAKNPVFERHTIVLKKILQAYIPFIEQGFVCIGTDSIRHAIEYKQLAGIEVNVFPHPKVEHSFLNKASTKDKPGQVVLSCLGPPRIEKGIDILLEAIDYVLSANPNLNVQFVIQWNCPVYLSGGDKLMIPPGFANNNKVIFIKKDLTSKEFEAYLLATDCMILPYKREVYHTRLSGLAVDTALAGIPMIYTKDTWLEDAVNEYGAGIGFKNNDSFDLAEKIIEAISIISELKQEATQKALLAREYHSKENMLKSLWLKEV